MKKRAISLLLALVMVLGLLPVTARAETLDNGLEYEVVDDHVEITGYTGDAAEVVIPAEIEGLPVTVIGNLAFENCESLTSIVIPDSVTSIGTGTFQCCTSLTSIDLPDNLTRIAEYAFLNCSSLTSIKLPDNLIAIDANAFSYSGLSSIDLPAGVTSIGNWAFEGCKSLTSICFNGDAPKFGANVFQGITATVYYPVGNPTWTIDVLQSYNGTTTWAAFDPTPIESSLVYEVYEDHVEISRYTGTATLIRIPAEIDGLPVTVIGEAAFADCSGLVRIDVPGSVTSVGSRAFSACTGLSSICFNGDAPEFGEGVFSSVLAIAFYPQNNATWNETGVKQDYQGKISWISHNDSHVPEYITVVTAPTCTENGSLKCTFTCICQGVLTQRVDARGHHFAGGICTRCGEAAPEGQAPAADPCDGMFSADAELTRGMFLYALWRHCGSPAPQSSDPPFTDIDTADYYYDAVIWGVETGITSGLSATEFGPDIIVNRASAATFLYRALAGGASGEYVESPYADVPEGTFFYKACCWVSENSFMTALNEEGFFKPNETCLYGHIYWDSSAPDVTDPLPDSAPDSDLIYNDLLYKIRGDYVEITGYNGTVFSVIIPDKIDGLPVAAIADEAFAQCETLQSIMIPHSVTSIGTNAFIGCPLLGHIHVDVDNPNYSNDEHGALFNKTKTQLIRVPAHLQESYRIPDSVCSIRDYAFFGCAELFEIFIPEHVSSIGDQAFSGCSMLVYIHFEGDAPTFGADVFRGVTTRAYYPSDLSTWTADVRLNYGGTITWIPSTPAIEGYVYDVFEDHVEIVQYTASKPHVTIPAQIEGKPVTVIGYGAFAHCSSLVSISIPDTVTTIGDAAFEVCSNLVSVDIPNSVTSIGDRAFAYCSNLATIDIPDSVTSIGTNPFHACNRLTEIHVGQDNPCYSTDGQSVLFDKEKTLLIQAPCTIQGFYTVPDSVTHIGDSAFFSCKHLTGISLPDSVAHIGYHALSGCSSLTEIRVDPNNPFFSSDDQGILFDKEKTLLIQAPGSITACTVPYGVTSIGFGAFRLCYNLTGIDLPDTVTSIGDSAFSDCFNLTGIDLPEGITFIGDNAFIGCEGLSDISIPDDTASIGSKAFESCTNLTSIDLPASITSIGSEAFALCSGLRSIRFQGDMPQLAGNAFLSVTATAYYPAGNPTWTDDVLQNYSSTISWIGYDPEGTFYDVQVGSFYETPVEWAVKNSITTGTSAITFAPSGDCLRAQVVTFLHRAARNPEPTTANNPFSDVKTGDFFYKPVLWAVEKNITNGVSANRFGSYDVCNRAAVVTFLWRAAGSPAPKRSEHPFTDVPDGAFYENAVLWALENDITQGISATEFGPTTSCNRAQVVTFLYRAYS